MKCEVKPAKINDTLSSLILIYLLGLICLEYVWWFWAHIDTDWAGLSRGCIFWPWLAIASWPPVCTANRRMLPTAHCDHQNHKDNDNDGVGWVPIGNWSKGKSLQSLEDALALVSLGMAKIRRLQWLQCPLNKFLSGGADVGFQTRPLAAGEGG